MSPTKQGYIWPICGIPWLTWLCASYTGCNIENASFGKDIMHYRQLLVSLTMLFSRRWYLCWTYSLCQGNCKQAWKQTGGKKTTNLGTYLEWRSQQVCCSGCFHGSGWLCVAMWYLQASSDSDRWESMKLTVLLCTDNSCRNLVLPHSQFTFSRPVVNPSY